MKAVYAQGLRKEAEVHVVTMAVNKTWWGAL